MSGDGGLWVKRSARRPRSTRQRINHNAIKALAGIVVVAVSGIIAISITSLLLQADLLAGLFDGIEQNPDASASVDEALSVLGNIAAASVGGLVGWLTRDYVGSSDVTPESEPVEVSEPEPEPTDG